MACRQAKPLSEPNAGILLIGPLGINFSEILIEIYVYFIQENAFENVVRKMAAILSRPQCVKWGVLPQTALRLYVKIGFRNIWM